MTEKSINLNRSTLMGWITTGIVILFGCSFVMNFLRVPPTMPLLIGYFQIDLTLVGLIMSVPSIAMVIGSLIGGVISAKLGAKKTMIVCLACGLLGSIIGVVCGTNFTVFLIGRFFDGASFAFAGVALPAIISMWFPKQKRGLPLAIWSLWVNIGQFIIFQAAAPIVAIGGGWQSVWLSVIFYTLILAVAFFVFVKPPKQGEIEQDNDGESSKEPVGEKLSIFAAFKLPYAWLLLLIDLIYTIAYNIFSTYDPLFMQEALGLDLASANSLFSLTTVSSIVASLIMGFVLNRLDRKKHPILLALGLIPILIVFVATFMVSSPAILAPLLIITGAVIKFEKPTLMAIAPNLADNPNLYGPLFSMIFLGTSLGSIVGPMLVGPVVQTSAGNDWGNLAILLAVLMGIAVLAGFLLVREASKIYKKKAAQGAEN